MCVSALRHRGRVREFVTPMVGGAFIHPEAFIHQHQHLAAADCPYLGCHQRP